MGSRVTHLLHECSRILGHIGQNNKKPGLALRSEEQRCLESVNFHSRIVLKQSDMSHELEHMHMLKAWGPTFKIA
jgi:hypothetical protein